MKIMGLNLTAGDLGTEELQKVIHGAGVVLREIAEQGKDSWQWEDLKKILHDMESVPENKQALLDAVNAIAPALKEGADLSWSELIGLVIAALQEAASVKEGYELGDDDPPIDLPV